MIKKTFTLLLITFSFLTHSKTICTAQSIGKEFHLSQNKIGMINKKFVNRSVASQEGYYFINFHKTEHNNSVTRILNFEGKKYTIFIKDAQSFSEDNDSLTIRSQKGHEISYPLTCI